MSLITNKDLENPESFYGGMFQTEPQPECCFYCGERLTIPICCWAGTAPLSKNHKITFAGHQMDCREAHYIWLHQKCVEEFCSAFIKDAWREL